jgi:transcriptional regulator GlxA family with amidase domain
LRALKKGCLVTLARKFELLDGSFRHAIQENLSGKEWIRSLFSREFTASRVLTSNEIIKKALDYMATHLDSVRTTKQVAAHLKMSPRYFDYFFRKHMKMGCGVYLARIRMEQADVLIKNDKLSLKEIADKLGFRHPQDFSRVFRKHFGKTPSSVRKATSRH